MTLQGPGPSDKARLKSKAFLFNWGALAAILAGAVLAPEVLETVKSGGWLAIGALVVNGILREFTKSGISGVLKPSD